MKNLCKKFGEAGNHVTLVRYEDMINYLAKSRMEALRAPPPMPGQRSGVADLTTYEIHSQLNINPILCFCFSLGSKVRRCPSPRHSPCHPNNNTRGR